MFLDELIAISDARIIEVGCGSGATAVSLASLGYSVAASDLDSDMITTARESFGDRVDFSVDNMISALEKIPAHSADAVLCLGNTLPHLTG
ncbi:MAG: methyltransferase domain-containing protein, partial [Spirochaetaceae bacterium]|nr:methyltransferase domain-containing protein [Spirochaetaceae bacterium]